MFAIAHSDQDIIDRVVQMERALDPVPNYDEAMERSAPFEGNGTSIPPPSYARSPAPDGGWSRLIRHHSIIIGISSTETLHD